MCSLASEIFRQASSKGASSNIISSNELDRWMIRVECASRVSPGTVLGASPIPPQ